MAFETTKQEIIKQAIALNTLWKQTRDQKYRDEELRLRRIALELENTVIGGTGVTKIIAGTNITVSPSGGTGDVTINATTALVPEPTGYGSFYSNVTQTLSAANTPQAVTLGQTYEAVGTSTSGSRIYMDKAGTYQFSYVAQVASSANSQEYAEFWIEYNGVNYPNSNTKLILQPRKSSTEPSEQLMTLIINGTSLNDNDYIELFWEATSTEVSLKYDPANASYPATPSIIANIIPIGAQGRDSNLNELNDVLISTPTDGQALVYDSTTSKWINEDPKDILNSTLLTNQTVGGVASGASYPTGTPLETIVRNILVTYIPPSFNTLRARNGTTTLGTGTYEIGTTFTVNNFTATIVADNPNGNPPTNGTISVSGAQAGNGNIQTGLTLTTGTYTSPTFTATNYTRNTNGSVTFTISGLDANSVLRSVTQSYSFQSYNYFGGASTLVNSDATATSVRNTIQSQRKAFDTNRAWSTTGTTQTNDPANFTYIMYPASYGDLTSVLLGATPVLGAFTKIGDFNILTENGNVTVSYRVYKSNATGAFANGASLTIS
jgi:hypothetical protein